MDKKLIKNAFGWGFTLWLIGYILGIVLFMAVPPSILGWVIMPIGAVITVWVLLRKIESNFLWHYLCLAVVWTLLAVVLDYFLLVKIFNPADGYYKTDVYLYYTLTFVLPLIIGWNKKSKSKTA